MCSIKKNWKKKILFVPPESQEQNKERWAKIPGIV